MDEYSRIIIEQYCMEHNSKKSRWLRELVEMSYTYDDEPDEEDALFLEKTIKNEKDSKLKEALEDLSGYLFG